VESDASYFERRAREEREAARAAVHPNARLAHLELAERYEDLANAITERENFLGLRVIEGGRGAGQSSLNAP
jgi:hypothetical protein